MNKVKTRMDFLKPSINVSLTHPCIHSSIHAFIHSFTHSFIDLDPEQLPVSQIFLNSIRSKSSSSSQDSGTESLKRSRRGYRAYFYNYLDEIAMSICAALPSEGPGLIYAVRRTCGEKPTCKDICTDHALRKQGLFIFL